MNIRRAMLYVVCSVLLTGTGGCSGCEEASESSWQLDDHLPGATPDASSPDVSEPADTRTPPDTPLPPPPPDSGVDSGPTEPVEDPGQPIAYDPALWHQPNPCQGQVSYPAPDRAFDSSRGSFGHGGTVMTRDQYLSRRSSIDGNIMGHLIADGSLLWSGHLAFDFYIDPTRDIDLHFYALNGRELDDYRLSLTVLLDHEPVEAKIVRWNPDRTEKWLETTASGLSIPFRSDVELIDVTLPAALFDEERAYEITFSHQLYSTEQPSDGGTQRFIVYNKSFERPDRPCAEPALGAQTTPIERYMMRNTAARMSALFFEGITNTFRWSDTLEVAPGETRRFFVSVLRNSVRSGPKPSVHVPVLDGEPIGDAWWVMQGSEDEDEYLELVDARKSFEVTFPEEPGVHELQVIGTIDPFELWRDLDGETHSDISHGNAFSAGSNPIRVVVTDEAE